MFSSISPKRALFLLIFSDVKLLSRRTKRVNATAHIRGYARNETHRYLAPQPTVAQTGTREHVKSLSSTDMPVVLPYSQWLMRSTLKTRPWRHYTRGYVINETLRYVMPKPTVGQQTGTRELAIQSAPQICRQCRHTRSGSGHRL